MHTYFQHDEGPPTQSSQKIKLSAVPLTRALHALRSAATFLNAADDAYDAVPDA